MTLELQAKVLEGSGTLENKEEGGEMFARAVGICTFKEVTVTAPAGKGCFAKGAKEVGTISTENLIASTKGLTNEVRFTPEGGDLAVFRVEGCSIAALNHKYELKGSVIGKTEGATTKFTHEGSTTPKTLSLSGQNAGIEGSLTTHGPDDPLVLT